MEIKFHGGDEASGEVFIVETDAEAGYMLGSHIHKHAHTSILVHGIADVTIDGVTKRYVGYTVLQVPADTVHEVSAVTDIKWLCIWNCNLAPREEAEESLKLIPTNEFKCVELKPCRSPYCECEQGKCSHPGFFDARHLPNG